MPPVILEAFEVCASFDLGLGPCWAIPICMCGFLFRHLGGKKSVGRAISSIPSLQVCFQVARPHQACAFCSTFSVVGLPQAARSRVRSSFRLRSVFNDLALSSTFLTRSISPKPWTTGLTSPPTSLRKLSLPLTSNVLPSNLPRPTITDSQQTVAAATVQTLVPSATMSELL